MGPRRSARRQQASRRFDPVAVDHAAPGPNEEPGDHSHALVSQDRLYQPLHEGRIALDVIVDQNDDRRRSPLDAPVHASGEPIVAIQLDELDSWEAVTDQRSGPVRRAVVDDDHAVFDGLGSEALEAAFEEVTPVPRRNDDIDRCAHEAKTALSLGSAVVIWEARRRECPAGTDRIRRMPWKI